MTEAIDLIGITRDIIAAIHQFKGVLAEETQALEQRDPGALLEVAERKTRYADHLDQLVKSRSRMFRSLGVNENDDGAVASLFQAHGQERLVMEDWGNALHTLRECQTMNQQAGADIQAQSSYVRRGLEVIGGKPLHHSYSASGYFVDENFDKELGTA